MPNNINSASRLVQLLQSVPSAADNTQVLDVWANFFSIEEQNTNKKSSIVAERLNAMSRELEIVQEQMRNANFSENLYESCITNLEHAFSTMLLPATWGQVRQYLKRETFVALSFCGEILSDEESQIDAHELSEIRLQVKELQTLLINSQLPQRLRILIQHHIDLIFKALDEYPITGAKALREAARTALGEIIEVKDVISENRESQEVNKLGNVWNRVNQTADAALKAEKLAQLGQKVWETLGNFF